jgi:very-short-patch-repair endonuclease
VVDFYAPRCKLAVEVDGDSHFTDHGPASDRERTNCLGQFGIEVIRFTNAEVHEQLDAVANQIAIAVQRRSQPPLAPPC